jgi:hypothetical protein
MSVHNAPLEIPIQHVLAFDNDDAFAMADSPVALSFSREAIREEIARSVDATDTRPEEEEEENASVSTLDISGNGTQTPENSEGELSAEFSQISLSNGVDAPYPAVIIDASLSSLPEPDPVPQQNPTTTPPDSPSTSTLAIPPLTVTTNTHHPSNSSQKPQLSVQKPTHRPSRSTGPSTFERVRSRTRPMFLPPKPKAEDEKHLADWERMMELSRTKGPCL